MLEKKRGEREGVCLVLGLESTWGCVLHPLFMQRMIGQ